MRKKQGFMKLISLFVSTMFIFSFVVSCGGGSSSGGPAPITYTSSSEAAASAKAMTGAMTLTSTIGADAMSSLGGATSTLAPRIRKSPANTDSIANIDPSLKTMVQKMSTDLRGSGIKSAVQKLRSARLLSSGVLSATTVTTGTCPGGSGSYTGTITDNSTLSVEDISISITFENCQLASSPSYTVISGGMSLYERYDGTNYTDTATLSSLTFNVYSSLTSTTPYETDILNGTFNVTGNATSETDSANASFSVAANGTVETLNLNHLSNRSTVTTDLTGVETDDDIMNGSIVFSVSGGATPFSLTLSFSNLEDKVRYNVDATSSVDEWLNGTLSLTWNPDLTASGCMPGSLTLTTVDKLHYNSLASYDSGNCPDTGTLQVNNATIVFGTSISVTVGSDTGYFTCATLGSTSCTNNM